MQVLMYKSTGGRSQLRPLPPCIGFIQVLHQLHLSPIGLLLSYRHVLNVVLHYKNELVIDPNGQITENLSVLREIKMLQAVLILMRGVVFHKFLCYIVNTNIRDHIYIILVN